MPYRVDSGISQHLHYDLVRDADNWSELLAGVKAFLVAKDQALLHITRDPRFESGVFDFALFLDEEKAMISARFDREFLGRVANLGFGVDIATYKVEEDA
jgi:hypothetical protein